MFASTPDGKRAPPAARRMRGTAAGANGRRCAAGRGGFSETRSYGPRTAPV
jgi:hypothetical protein